VIGVSLGDGAEQSGAEPEPGDVEGKRRRESAQRDYRLPEWSSLPAIKVESGRNLRCLDNEPRLNY